eukprot:2616238-Rhodomonas_salina.3
MDPQSQPMHCYLATVVHDVARRSRQPWSIIRQHSCAAANADAGCQTEADAATLASSNTTHNNVVRQPYSCFTICSPKSTTDRVRCLREVECNDSGTGASCRSMDMPSVKLPLECTPIVRLTALEAVTPPGARATIAVSDCHALISLAVAPTLTAALYRTFERPTAKTVTIVAPVCAMLVGRTDDKDTDESYDTDALTLPTCTLTVAVTLFVPPMPAETRARRAVSEIHSLALTAVPPILALLV